MFFKRDVIKLEHDPEAQYKFNRLWAIIWFLTMVGIPFIPTLYAHQISALLIQEISLWANFATHFGAMSAALAAMQTSKTVQDISQDVDEIHEVTTELEPWTIPVD